MKGKELLELAKRFPDFDFEFSFVDETRNVRYDIRHFENLVLDDVGYSDKKVVLGGEERC